MTTTSEKIRPRIKNEKLCGTILKMNQPRLLANCEAIINQALGPRSPLTLKEKAEIAVRIYSKSVKQSIDVSLPDSHGIIMVLPAEKK
ncbi:MAG: hypothetical protein QME51_01720 [Planctomycetota bacterium]|nr:hypothetical protein [Planctomycetota bacterium]